MKNKINLFVKEKIMYNLPYKLLSIVVAVMIWLVIINIADPVTTRKFTGLNVNVINQSVISSVNQVYEIESGDTVDFVVRGKASVVKNLKLSDFNAYADLSKLSPVYAADIVVQCTKTAAEGLEIDSGNSVLIVKLEEVETKNVQITVETTGQVAEGYYVDDYEVKPNMITVSGGISKISRIDSIKVMVNVDGAKRNFKSVVQPIPYDKDGNKIDPEYCTFINSGNVIDKVAVTTIIYQTKTIPINVAITGKPAAGYQYSQKYEYTPEIITIGGSRKALAKVNSLTIPVDITGESEECQENVDISKYLPDGIKSVGNEENISVNVTFDKIEKKSVNFKASDIEFNNVPDGYDVELHDSDKTYDIYLSGTGAQLAQYSSLNLKPHVDLSEDTIGECHIQVQFSEQVTKLLSSEAPVVWITLSEKNSPAHENPNTDTEETSKPDGTAKRNN